jgi:hypothetical protein
MREFSVSRVEFMERIVDDYKKGGHEAVAESVEYELVSWYSESRIEQLIQKWGHQGWLTQRLNLLVDGCHAHLDGKYYLSISALLPQIEGIIIQNFRILGYIKQKKIKDHLYSILHPAIIVSHRNEAIRRFVENVLFAKFEYGFPVESILSRNAITHGLDLDYDSRANSLRTILLCDAVIRLFTFESSSADTYFHFNGCINVAGTDEERIFFATMQEAMSKAKLPCEKCLGNEDSRV